MPKSETETAVARLRGTTGAETIDLGLGGQSVPVKFRHVAESDSLVILFRGAVDRTKSTLPAFAPFVKSLSTVSQLTVADPSMLRPGSHSMAWYAGHDGFPAQDILAEFFTALAESFGFRRVVFFGGSGGGFAALYFSTRLARSICLAVSPQTRLEGYYSGHLRRYIEACWPSLSSGAELAERIKTDMCKLYSEPQDNLVIYVQSAGDHFHNRTQLAPFLSSIAAVKASRFILSSGYWGHDGHSGSVTDEGYLPWLRAALLTPSLDVDDTLTTYHQLVSGDVTARAPGADGPGGDRSGDLRDVRLADLLRAYHLRASEEA